MVQVMSSEMWIPANLKDETGSTLMWTVSCELLFSLLKSIMSSLVSMVLRSRLLGRCWLSPCRRITSVSSHLETPAFIFSSLFKFQIDVAAE